MDVSRSNDFFLGLIISGKVEIKPIEAKIWREKNRFLVFRKLSRLRRIFDSADIPVSRYESFV